jgi:predicted deacetylase
VSHPPALLVSLHDVSPLTLESSQEALAIVRAAGLGPADLTVLVIPFHEGRAPLDHDRQTVRWLEGLVGEGATLALHGLTHRMRERAGLSGWFWGYGFARGQGELYRADQAATERCLEEGLQILERAGLRSAVTGFVPPAWLLSRAALGVVERTGLLFHELMSGIVSGGAPRARRLIGWGSLTAIESLATSIFARWQTLRAPADTRLAIHPADMRRAGSRRSVARTLARVRERFQPASYAGFLARQTAAV